MNDLKNKIAIVTGASRGIGREIAVSLGKMGAKLVLAARNKELLEEVAQQIKDNGANAEIFQLELENEDSIKALVDFVKDKFGALDILVNNAGITHSASLEETATEDYDKVMSVNVRGPFILCREALGLLRKSDSGRIINISSVVGVKGYPQQSAYTASKHALRGMSISLANELKGTSIRVHVICPGGVNTEMVERVRPDINKDELIGSEEVAELVGYLASCKGNGIVDEIRIRRQTSDPWF
ncbi:MAG TPA: SDR family oxidoreductase [Phycisphaerales bacterium]|nr:SDR family oxidoreductase [Phycisphaerales bacterium]